MNTTTEPTGKRCATGILLILLSLATVVFLKACGVIHAAPPRIDLIKVGMTVAEVDGALGKPESVMDMPDLPAEQIRVYFGDGDHRIRVRFKNGVATHIKEHV